MSDAKWETYGGVRYKVDGGQGSVDRDGWTRLPTNPKIIVCGQQEYQVVRELTKEEAIAISLKKWAERIKKEKGKGKEKKKEEKK
jgi:hypothetical protein